MANWRLVFSGSPSEVGVLKLRESRYLVDFRVIESRIDTQVARDLRFSV
jgi:hypothetical protein